MVRRELFLLPSQGLTWGNPLRAIRRLLQKAGNSIFATTIKMERYSVFFHLIAAPVLGALLPLARERTPKWEFALAAVAIMFAAHLALLFALSQIHYLQVAVLSTFLDTVLVLFASSVLMRASAFQEKASDLWLVFPLLILTVSTRLRAFSSILYTLIIVTWYSAYIGLLFPRDSRAFVELPVRAGFFLLIGLVIAARNYALSKSNEG